MVEKQDRGHSLEFYVNMIWRRSDITNCWPSCLDTSLCYSDQNAIRIGHKSCRMCIGHLQYSIKGRTVLVQGGGAFLTPLARKASAAGKARTGTPAQDPSCCQNSLRRAALHHLEGYLGNQNPWCKTTYLKLWGERPCLSCTQMPKSIQDSGGAY